MLAVIRRNPMAAVFAIILHLLLAAFILFGGLPEKPPEPPATPIMQARLIDAAPLEARHKQQERAEQQRLAASEKTRQEDALRQQAQARREQEKKRQAEAAEQQRREQAEQEKKRQAEAAEQQRREQAEQEKKRQAEAAEQQRREQAEQEKKRQAEAAERKRREQAEQEKKRQAEAAERKRREQAEQEKKRRAAQQAREAEAARLAAAEAERAAAQQAAREVARYRTAIQQKIEGKWIRPPRSENLKCTLQVRLMPGGGVLSVQVTESSGSSAFDKSVEDAVYRADPLPVPGDALFERFRTLIFVFDPSKN
jgi:colicin import membrane protein